MAAGKLARFITQGFTACEALPDESAIASVASRDDVVIAGFLDALPREGLRLEHMLDMHRRIFKFDGRWFYMSQSEALKRKLCKLASVTCKEHVVGITFSCLALQALGLGKVATAG